MKSNNDYLDLIKEDSLFQIDYEQLNKIMNNPIPSEKIDIDLMSDKSEKDAIAYLERVVNGKPDDINKEISTILDNFEKSQEECLNMWDKYAARTSELDKETIRRLKNVTGDAQFVREWIQKSMEDKITFENGSSISAVGNANDTVISKSATLQVEGDVYKL